VNRTRPNEPPMPDPLAFFLTWPTYGTWLPGDERGWVLYSVGRQSPDEFRRRMAEMRMKEGACRLDPEQRQLVEMTIRRHCEIRGWELLEINCRSNHLHVVFNGDRDPDVMRTQFKAWCTRRLKERDISCGIRPTDLRQQWWAERGSCRYINDDESLENARLYVRDAQDHPAK
jgi:REP element-mobilizing transposase RayT